MVLSSRRDQWLSCTSAVPSESVSVFFVCIAIQKCGKICQSYSISNIDVSTDLVRIYYTDKWPVLMQRQWCQTSKTCISFLCLSSLFCSSKVIHHHTRVMSVYAVEAAYTHSTYLKTSYVLVFSFHIFGGHPLSWYPLGYTTETVFNILPSIIEMFLFSVLFRYLFSYCIFL
jgi:hypothetical protein